jgi:hypothetical protein
MAVYDYFVASLRCPACGAVSPENDTTGMRTRDGCDVAHRGRVPFVEGRGAVIRVALPG